MTFSGAWSQPKEAAPVVARPLSVLEVGPFQLDFSYQVFIDEQARVQAVQPKDSEPGSSPQAMWDGPSGYLIRCTLNPLDPETWMGGGCGCLSAISSTALWPNQAPERWDPLRARFQWTAGDGNSKWTMDSDGNLARGPQDLRPTTKLVTKDSTGLEVQPPGREPWSIARRALVPAGVALTSLQKAVMGQVGFQHAIADRAGGWVATIWEGTTSNLGSRLAPYTRDGNRLWNLWYRGASYPVQEETLAAVLGGEDDLLRMSLNEKGDRILLESSQRVVLFAPDTHEVLSRHAGCFVGELPTRNQILIRTDTEPSGAFMIVDLGTGEILKKFVLQDLVGAPDTGKEGRELMWPIAFSPAGRYMVTPRAGTQGIHWDELVIWDLDQL
jgi:hypothetical protein